LHCSGACPRPKVQLPGRRADSTISAGCYAGWEAEMTIATGTITGGNGQPAIQVVVTLAVSQSTWTGSLRASSPLSPDKRPQKGWMYRLRLEDDRERYISIDSVTTGETWLTAVFTA